MRGMIDAQIAAAADRITRMEPEEFVTWFRFARPVREPLADWLIRAAWRTIDLSDAAYVQAKLTEFALGRVLEALAGMITECEPDCCYPLEEPYRFRVSHFRHELAGLVSAASPIVLLDLIDPLLHPDIERGCARTAILDAWDALNQAVTRLYPNPTRTQATLRERREALSA